MVSDLVAYQNCTVLLKSWFFVLSYTDEVEVKETNNGHAPVNTSAKKTLDEKEIIAQCLIFFIAGSVAFGLEKNSLH